MKRIRFGRRPKRHRARRRRRHLRSVLLAGATTLFVPHAGKLTPKPRPASTSASVAAAPVRPEPLSAIFVTINEDYKVKPETYEPLIAEASTTYNVSPALIRAVITTESAFDPLAVSSAGAQGLMQLMPALSEELGVTDPFDARQNIMAGSQYLGILLALHDGDVPLALASYNAGPGAVELYGGIPPFEETETYVRRVMAMMNGE